MEELSQYVDYTSLPQPDGSVSIYVGGQVPLVIGDHAYQLAVDNSNPNQTAIRDERDNDVTSTVTRGKLAAQIEIRNETIQDLRGDLNTLATTFADQVNFVLSQGLDTNGTSPIRDLFTYDPAGSAATLGVNPLDPSELAGAAMGNPGGNDNILNLVSLSHTQQVNGMTFTQFYGQMTASVGRDLQAANDDKAVRDQLLSQAHDMRKRSEWRVAG